MSPWADVFSPFWAYVKLSFSTNFRSLVTKEFYSLLAFDRISILLDRLFGLSIQVSHFVVKSPFSGFQLNFYFFFFIFFWFKLPFQVFTLNLFLFLSFFSLLLVKAALLGFQLWHVASLVISSIILLYYVGINGAWELFPIHFDEYQCSSWECLFHYIGPFLVGWPFSTGVLPIFGNSLEH